MQPLNGSSKGSSATYTCCTCHHHVLCLPCPHADASGLRPSQEPWLVALLLCQAALLAAIVLFRQSQTFTAAVFASAGESCPRRIGAFTSGRGSRMPTQACWSPPAGPIAVYPKPSHPAACVSVACPPTSLMSFTLNVRTQPEIDLCPGFGIGHDFIKTNLRSSRN